MPKKKKSWDLHEGRRAYKNDMGVYVDPEIKELYAYNKRRKK